MGGTEFIQFLAALAVFQQDDFYSKNRMNSYFSSNYPGEIHPILQFVLAQNRERGKELNKFCPLNSSKDLCLFFCIFLLLLLELLALFSINTLSTMPWLYIELSPIRVALSTHNVGSVVPKFLTGLFLSAIYLYFNLL